MLLSIRYVQRARSATALVAVATAILLVALLIVVGATVGEVQARGTVVYDEAGDDATDIGLIGDSSLAGVRWYDAYGDLREYNYLFDAESCRRTVETSCWSREGYRPDNALITLQQHWGQWGDVLVVMSGYNDTNYLFDDAVDEVVAEAQRQDVSQVVWMTLRTSDVNYEEPLHQANGDTYGDANRMLFEAAEEHGDYLQIADWATYSAPHSEWLAADGVHLTAEGAAALSTFIAGQTDAVLDGENITPEQPPWRTLAEGDSGDAVAEVQRAVADEGVSSVGDVDGEYGTVTANAVQQFQQSQELEPTGEVGVPTAVALGLYEEPTFGDEPNAAVGPTGDGGEAAGGPAPQDRSSSSASEDSADPDPIRSMSDAVASIEVTDPDGSSFDRRTVIGGVVVVGVGVTTLVVGARRARGRGSGESSFDAMDTSADERADGFDHDPSDDATALMERPFVLDLYDHEQEESFLLIDSVAAGGRVSGEDVSAVDAGAGRDEP